MGDLPDEVGKGVQRQPGLNQSGDLAVDVLHPVQNRLAEDHEHLCSSLEGHTVSASMQKDRQPLPALEVGASVGFDLEEAGSKDRVLGPETIDALAKRENLLRFWASEGRGMQSDAAADPTGDEQKDPVH
jgi:hypothetical protein